MNDVTHRRSARPRARGKGVLSLALFLAAQITTLGTSWGDTASAAADAAPEASASAAVPAPLKVLSAAATCSGCAPDDTEIELFFSVPVDAHDVASSVAQRPEVALSSATAGVRRRVRLGGDFAPQTRYSVTLPVGFCAPTGECLSEPTIVSFRTGGGQPVVRMPVHQTVLPPGGKVPMRIANVERAEVRIIDVLPAEIAPVMALVGFHYPGRDPFALLPAAMQRRARRLEIDPDALNDVGEYEVDPFAHVPGKLALVLLTAKGATSKLGLYQRGTVGALLKVGGESGLVWATDTNTGRPIPGAAVTVLAGTTARWTGTTGADGIARLPSRRQLSGATTGAPLFAVVRAKGETVVTGHDFSDGVDPWYFDLPHYYYYGQEGLRGVLATERGIYRPGETVHVVAVLRRRVGDGRLAAPLGTVEVTLRDPEGSEIARRTEHLTAFGTARLTLALPRVAGLGRYTLELVKDGVCLRHDVEVAEFRAASFEVELPPAGPADFVGDAAVIPIEARYLHGAPVANGKVKWSASWRHRRVTFQGYEPFDFAGSQPHYYSNPIELTEGETTLDAHGRTVVHIPKRALPGEDDGAQAIDLLLEATVTDVGDDTISARTVQRIDRTDAFVGVATDRWVVEPRQGWDVKVVALDRHGRPTVGRHLVLALERRFWNSVAEQGPHGIRFRTSREEVVVEARTIVSEATAVPLHFDLPGGGEYELRIHEQGRAPNASAQVWAWDGSGHGEAANEPRLRVRADRDAYAPGDTAHLHAAIPYPKATALLTVERTGILSARVVEIGSQAGSLDVPIAERHLPNVYVGLAVVPRDNAGATPTVGSPFKVGYVELSVNPESRRLDVSLEPGQEKQQPGSPARVKVHVRDHTGKPVQAEVTLWAVDEGVLMLTGYETPDPFAPAYAPHELDVDTASNLLRWIDYDPERWGDGGGDSGGSGSAMRSRFLATAFFSRGVVTDTRGDATIDFRLPDNATRWRVMAVAADRGERFGRGEATVTAQKPLLVTSALPRFANQGDLVDAGVVVHNQTGSAATFAVKLAATGGKILGASQQDVTVAQGTSEQVRFPLVVGEHETLGLQAEVSGNGERDGFALTLPVHYPATEERVMITEGILDGQSTVEFAVPSVARPGSPVLEIVASPSLLASLAPGVESLLEYPYGCAEQKTSRLIPMVILGDLISELGVRGFDPREHRTRLEDTIAALTQHQNDDGGFGLWVESDTDPFVTAYVVFGWLVAKDHGYPVPEGRLSTALRYLRAGADAKKPVEGYFGLRADPLSGYVLARAGAEDGGLLERLASGHAELSRADLAFVAAGLAYRQRSGGSDSALSATLAELASARRGSDQRATISERAASASRLEGSALRTTALAAHAFLVAGKTAEAEALVRGVLAERGPDGTWGSTYDNLLAVLAIGDVVSGTPASRKGGEVAVSIGGGTGRQLRLGDSKTIARAEFSADALPAPGDSALLGLTPPAGARFEVVARLRFLPEVKSQSRRSRGYEIERAVVDATTGQVVTNPAVGQVLRVRLTVKTPAGRRQVALTDHLPAGWEAINTRLATERQDTSAQSSWEWVSSEIRDERVSFFAHDLATGSTTADYFARVSRSGEFTWPAATVESMYEPEQDARTGVEQVIVPR
ncbi:MAG: hypothetical protein JW751_30860 [Polyangiaceae bacterium]|nr:hypothetical protein [Polyangiaceae bacterium]